MYAPSWDLPLARCTFFLAPHEPLVWSAFAGVMLRGAFGTILRRHACTTGVRTCEGCSYRDRCAYGVLFDPVLLQPSDGTRGMSTPPRPFVFSLRADSRQRNNVRQFDVLLVGPARRYFAEFLRTFIELETCGLGPRRVPFRLSHVDAMPSDGSRALLFNREDGKTCQPPFTFDAHVAMARARGLQAIATGRWLVHFVTPTRLTAGGRVQTEGITFQDVVRRALRRLDSLLYLYGDGASSFRPHDYVQLAEGVRTLGTRFRWSERERFSTRQRQNVRVGGVLGSMLVEGDLTCLLPVLAYAEQVHIGKHTVMGFGRIALEACADTTDWEMTDGR